MITKNSRIPFKGRYKGKQLKDCPEDYLRWISKNLRDTDFHEFAIISEQLLKNKPDIIFDDDLDKAADDFLRKHGVDPSKL